MNSPFQRLSDAASRNKLSVRGFTLLELLIVITIMITITTMALINILGGTRSAKNSAAANDVFDCLTLCRQRACLDGVPACLYLIDSNNFIAVRAAGNIAAIGLSSTSGPTNEFWVLDDLSDMVNNGFVAPMRLVNMDRPGNWADIGAINAGTLLTFVNSGQCIIGNDRDYDVPNAFKLTFLSATNFTGGWQAGDAYGLELHAQETLPKGFHFCLGSYTGPLPDHARIVFKPDGTALCDDPKSTWADNGKSGWDLSIVEELAQSMNATSNSVIMTIQSNGKISSDFK